MQLFSLSPFCDISTIENYTISTTHCYGQGDSIAFGLISLSKFILKARTLIVALGRLRMEDRSLRLAWAME